MWIRLVFSVGTRTKGLYLFRAERYSRWHVGGASSGQFHSPQWGLKPGSLLFGSGVERQVSSGVIAMVGEMGKSLHPSAAAERVQQDASHQEQEAHTQRL